MSEAAVQVERLTHRYPREAQPAVEGLSFQVHKGEIVGLLGPNGAGKTTTLYAALGLLRPEGGSVRVLGHSPLKERLKVMPRINFASVDVELPSNLRVVECLSIFARIYGVRNHRQRIQEWTDRFELGTLLKHKVGSLSSGERMRLKLAKALLNNPEVLLLDEPTLSLDPYMAYKVRQLLRTILKEQQLAVLHTSHNMQEVETFCDRILFLNRGKLLVEGPPKKVIERFKSASLEELFIRVSESGELFHAE
jgi:ABC-2 type transport system ATP-binding protein